MRNAARNGARDAWLDARLGGRVAHSPSPSPDHSVGAEHVLTSWGADTASASWHVLCVAAVPRAASLVSRMGQRVTQTEPDVA